MKKIAEAVLAATAGVIVSAVSDCLLGHKQTGKCSFRNVQLPCAKDWLKKPDAAA